MEKVARDEGTLSKEGAPTRLTRLIPGCSSRDVIKIPGAGGAGNERDHFYTKTTDIKEDWLNHVNELPENGYVFVPFADQKWMYRKKLKLLGVEINEEYCELIKSA